MAMLSVSRIDLTPLYMIMNGYTLDSTVGT